MEFGFIRKIKSLSQNVIIALLISFSLIAIDQISKIYHNQFLGIISKNAAMSALIGLLLSLLKKTKTAIIIYSVMIFLMLLQLIHYNYFGTPISPEEISLLFTHSSETMTSFLPMLQIIVVPLLICIVASILPIVALLFARSRFKFRYAWIILLIAFLYPTVKIVNAEVKDQLGRRHHDSVGDRPYAFDDLWYSTQKTLVFYFLYTLPHEITGNTANLQPVKPPLAINIKNPNVNVIFFQGESLTLKHMSCYGYKRPTTPYLDSLKNQNNVVFKFGISSGVCTDVSLPLFFNMIRRPDGSHEIASTHRNLFKMAEQNGFETHFISTHQAGNFGLIQEYLFPAYINHFAVLGRKQYALDNSLLNYLKKVDFSRPTFLVLQPGGSHSPYTDRYPAQFDYFKSDAATLFKQSQINAYDNSVRYTDYIVQQLIAITRSKTTRPTYIIFTSDHGEGLGDNGVFGHNNLYVQQEHEVPIMIMAINGASLDFLKQKTAIDINTAYMSHYELSKIIAKLLGYRIEKLSTQHSGYYVTGSILNGLAGYNHITFTPLGHLQNHFVNE